MGLLPECVILADLRFMPFRSKSSSLKLPVGYSSDAENAPNIGALNRLLWRCREETYSPKRLSLAIERSVYYLSIYEEASGSLAGFVRVTTDYGLNANLWNLVAQPGNDQESLLAVLVDRTLRVLRRDFPGCSISIAAPEASLKALQNHGFLIDPGGIRAMGLRLL